MHQCLSLLDTGSTISAINEQLFLKSKFANKSLKQSDISHIIAAAGATYPIKGMTTLNFEIGGAIISNKFYVIPALRHSFNWNNNILSLIKDSSQN